MLFQSQEIEENPSDHSEYERIKTQHDPSFGPTSCDIKPKLPTFSGGENLWEPFLMQLVLLSKSYGWSDAEFRCQLTLALKGDALLHVSSLPLQIRESTTDLLHCISQGFGQCPFPEIHRSNLYNMCQLPTESLQQYSARVNQLMTKAYPGMQCTSVYDSLSVEHFLRGLTDKSVAYEVYTKRPSDLFKAVEMVAWHEVCSKLVCQKVVSTEHEETYKTSRRQNRICYNCRKKGHEANICPATKTNPSQRRHHVPKPKRD